MKNYEIEWISKYLNIPVEITTDLSLISENEYDQVSIPRIQSHTVQH